LPEYIVFSVQEGQHRARMIVRYVRLLYNFNFQVLEFYSHYCNIWAYMKLDPPRLTQPEVTSHGSIPSFIFYRNALNAIVKWVYTSKS